MVSTLFPLLPLLVLNDACAMQVLNHRAVMASLRHTLDTIGACVPGSPYTQTFQLAHMVTSGGITLQPGWPSRSDPSR